MCAHNIYKMSDFHEERYHFLLVRASELLKQKSSGFVEFGEKEKHLRKKYMALLRRAAKYRKQHLQNRSVVVVE